MAKKWKTVVMCIVGAYLVCTGSLLVAETMKSHPSSENIFIASGVFFALFGVFVLGVHIRRLWKDRPQKEKVVERIEFEIEPVERSVEPKVQMIRLESKIEITDEDETEENLEIFEEVTEDVTEEVTEELLEDLSGTDFLEVEEEYEEDLEEDEEDEEDDDLETVTDEFEVKLEKV